LPAFGRNTKSGQISFSIAVRVSGLASYFQSPISQASALPESADYQGHRQLWTSFAPWAANRQALRWGARKNSHVPQHLTVSNASFFRRTLDLNRKPLKIRVNKIFHNIPYANLSKPSLSPQSGCAAARLGASFGTMLGSILGSPQSQPASFDAKANGAGAAHGSQDRVCSDRLTHS
jgi:hypothetical protein